MSSLAAARADSFYFPPDYRPEYGSLSKFNNKNFKGSNQYQQFGIIRFELPFDGWCLNCNHHMSKGLRFNAKKDKDGKYFTTQIWSFVMKCPECNHELKIKTDPKNCTYDFAEGIRKHEQDYTPDLDDNVEITNDSDTKQMMVLDPMYRLQHYQEDHQKIMTEQERFQDLVDIQEQQHKHDYDLNSKMRTSNRMQKKRRIALVEEATSKGLAIPLLEYHPDDEIIASNVVFKKHSRNRFESTENHKLASIQSQSIFHTNNNHHHHRGNDSDSIITKEKTTSNNKQHITSCSSNKIAKSREKGKKIISNSEYDRKIKLIAKTSALQIDSKYFACDTTTTITKEIISVPSITKTKLASHDSNKTIVSITTKQQQQRVGTSSAKNIPSEMTSSITKTTSSNQINLCSHTSSILNMLANYDDD